MSQMEIPIQTTADVTAVEVRKAARAFARALAETAEFQALEHATERLRQDETAQHVVKAFQSKQQSLQMMLILDAVSPEDRDEIERLRQAFFSKPSVTSYLQAQENLTVVCQAAADLLSQRVGLSFAAACGPGCC